MGIPVIVHKAEEGGFWGEVPSIPGCATQGETMEEIETNIREAIEGCLSVDVETPVVQLDDQVVELGLRPLEDVSF
jgi:predicted RNase H-like HicB family nuclease